MSVADVQQDSEITDLETVISLANETLFDLINATITANYTALLDALDTTYSDNTSDVSSDWPSLTALLLMLLLLPVSVQTYSNARHCIPLPLPRAV